MLYRLPELVAASTDATVFLVEGEKDADRLASLGLVVITCPGGANKWRPEYSKMLADRKVVILPDNDPAGAEHAETIKAGLTNIAGKVVVLALQDLPHKGDVSDWLDADGTAESLLAQAEEVLGVPNDAPAADSLIVENIEVTEDCAARIFTVVNRETMRFDHDAGKWFWWSGD